MWDEATLLSSRLFLALLQIFTRGANNCGGHCAYCKHLFRKNILLTMCVQTLVQTQAIWKAKPNTFTLIHMLNITLIHKLSLPSWSLFAMLFWKNVCNAIQMAKLTQPPTAAPQYTTAQTLRTDSKLQYVLSHSPLVYTHRHNTHNQLFSAPKTINYWAKQHNQDHF